MDTLWDDPERVEDEGILEDIDLELVCDAIGRRDWKGLRSMLQDAGYAPEDLGDLLGGYLSREPDGNAEYGAS